MNERPTKRTLLDRVDKFMSEKRGIQSPLVMFLNEVGDQLEILKKSSDHDPDILKLYSQAVDQVKANSQNKEKFSNFDLSTVISTISLFKIEVQKQIEQNKATASSIEKFNLAVDLVKRSSTSKDKYVKFSADILMDVVIKMNEAPATPSKQASVPPPSTPVVSHTSTSAASNREPPKKSR